MKKILFLTIVLFISASFAEDVGKGNRREVHAPKQKNQVATFAAGCFWCIQPVFDKAPGVIETHVGFSGGDEKNPTYALVSTGKTGHAEAIEVVFDPAVTSYKKLLELFWDNIDPTDGGGQYADRGPQYRPAIFYHDHEQEELAQESKERVIGTRKYSKPIAVQIIAYKFFAHVEGGEADIHEKYYQKNPAGYELYKKGSGRTKEIQQLNK